MVFDFVMDLKIIDPKEPVTGGMINDCALYLGIDNYYSFPNKRKKLKMVEKSMANRRLRPLVSSMLDIIESSHSDYSWKTRSVTRMIKEIYGIGTHKIDLVKAANRHRWCIERAQHAINVRMEGFSRSKRFMPWNFLFIAALYLPTSEYKKFCAALREKDAEMMRYKDLSPIYKCMNAK